MAFTDRLHNRGSISTGYNIDNSLKLEQPERITRGYAAISQKTSSDRKKTTLSYWVKRTQLNASGNGIVFIMYAGNTIMLGFENDKLRVSSSYGYSLVSNSLYRDTSAWYHLVFSIDTTQGTANDRVKAYVNGVEVTSWSTQTITISQNANNGMFNEVNGDHYFGWGDSQATGCYVAEAHCIDGQSLTASDFGEYDSDSGIWIPKEYEGTYGNQGYYLDFENASSLTDDSSGNSNNFTTFYAGGAENQATDTPTNNFCTLNPLGEHTGSAVINEGATKIDNSGTASWETAYSSIGVTSGKWYAEVTPQLGSFNTSFGIVNFDTAIHDGTTYNSAGYWLGNFDSGASIYYYFNGSGAGSIVVNVSAGVVIGLALDLDNNTLDFYVNGSQNKQATSLPSGTYGFIADVQGTGGPYIQCNFGGYTVNTISSAATDANGYGTFEYAPPSGYYALCTKNLAEYGG
jgi:hypothetical protein